MNRRFDEHALHDALHAALDETTVGEVAFDRVAAGGRRGQALGTAGVGAAVVAVVGAASFGLSGLGAPAGPGTDVGAAPVSPAPGPGAIPTAVLRSADPLPSDQPPPPSWTTTPRSTATPTTPAGWCPTHAEGGRIDWPPAHDDLLTEEPAWAGPASGPFLAFTATRVIICRYEANGSVAVGAADVTDKALVSRLQAQVGAATAVRTEDTCEMDGSAFITFADKDHGRNLWVNLTACDAWWMPYSVSITGGFADQVRTLTPDGSGRKR